MNLTQHQRLQEYMAKIEEREADHIRRSRRIRWARRASYALIALCVGTPIVAVLVHLART